jgi:hypothetical protein
MKRQSATNHHYSGAISMSAAPMSVQSLQQLGWRPDQLTDALAAEWQAGYRFAIQEAQQETETALDDRHDTDMKQQAEVIAGAIKGLQTSINALQVMTRGIDQRDHQYGEICKAIVRMLEAVAVMEEVTR